MQRENFRSRMGFLLVSAGCAIGIGNVWRFPTITGQYGGGYFVLFYLICLVIMGIPVMTMELAVGRASRKSAVRAYQTLEKPGQKWHIHGWFCMIGCCLLMMYYTSVTGWMVDYFCKFLTGRFTAGMDSEQINGVFGQMLSSPGELTIFMVIVVVAGFLICMTLLHLLRRRGAVWAALAAGCVLAVANELHQTLSEGRSCQFTDMLIDASGAALGLTAAALIVGWIAKRQAHRDRKGYNG